MMKQKPAKQRGVEMQMIEMPSTTCTLKLLPPPTFSIGVASLWQSLLDILIVAPQRMPQLSVQMDDKTALLGDVQIVLADARLAHQQLLSLYPELVP